MLFELSGPLDNWNLLIFLLIIIIIIIIIIVTGVTSLQVYNNYTKISQVNNHMQPDENDQTNLPNSRSIADILIIIIKRKQ